MAQRNMLVVSHTARPAAIEATTATLKWLGEHDIAPVMTAADYADFGAHLAGARVDILGQDIALSEIELAIVLGGDGTILRAAEVLRDAMAPIIGVNLGHVGFLAEKDHHDLYETLERVTAGDYTVEERTTLDVQVFDGSTRVHSTFAVNEATVEKTQRMIEVAIGVDSRPISAFGCDGVVISTPTGSTAYAFSAGGPIVWPEVAATLVVPLAAHALFSRPLVLSPSQTIETQLSAQSEATAALWCDGRRRFDLAPGQRVVVTHSEKKLRLARLAESEFGDRLVSKFQLPVTGWRGSGA